MAHANTKRQDSEKERAIIARELNLLYLMIGVISGAFVSQGLGYIIQASFLEANFAELPVDYQRVVLLEMGGTFLLTGLVILGLIVWIVRMLVP